MSPNEFAGLLHQILSGGVLVASLILKTVCLADHLSTEMPVTMINKPVALLYNIDRTYAGVEYMNENLEHVRHLHIDGPSYFDHSTTLLNVEWLQTQYLKDNPHLLP